MMSLALKIANVAVVIAAPLLGAGTLPRAYSRIIVAWFEKRCGLALGIALSGFGVGDAVVLARGLLGVRRADHSDFPAAGCSRTTREAR